MAAVDQTASPRRAPGAVGLSLLFTGFIAATYGFGVYLFPALMPDMLRALSLDYAQAGTIMAASQAGFLIAALASGILTHRIGASRLVLASVACCAICLLLVPFASGLVALSALMFATGAASASVWVPMVVIAKSAIPEAHQGKALGLMSSGTAYGVFVNGTAIPLLLPTYGWRSVWFFVAAVTLLLLALGMVRLIGCGKDTTGKTAAERPATPSPVRPGHLVIPAMMFLSGLACMPAQNYLVAFVRGELGHGVAAAGQVWTVIGVVGMVGGLLMGMLADRVTVKRTLVLAYLLLAASFAAFTDHRSLAAIHLGAALFGLSFNAIFGLVPAYVSLRYPAGATAMIFGIGNVLLGLGALTGNFLGGLIKQEAGSFQTIYVAALGLAVLLAGGAAVLRQPPAPSLSPSLSR